mmetsp:Transcript_62021/g.115965  ORF Transcript_62021/g.115965 Transcript_62021/m.115965 type:complete len:207 (-) Transcript_62021:57-677(-)
MAFEQQFQVIEAEAFHVLNCCCYGCSVGGCGDPCCLDKHKFLCCAGGCTSGEECVGQKGCLTALSKTLCIVQASSCNNFACGLCDMWLMGRPYGEGQFVNDGETAFMQNVFWVYYCVYAGCGVAPVEPFCFSNSKMCCIEAKDTTTECLGDEGLCHKQTKNACIVERSMCPPTRRIGIGCCGMALFQDPNEARAPNLEMQPGQQRM